MTNPVKTVYVILRELYDKNTKEIESIKNTIVDKLNEYTIIDLVSQKARYSQLNRLQDDYINLIVKEVEEEDMWIFIQEFKDNSSARYRIKSAFNERYKYAATSIQIEKRIKLESISYYFKN